MGYDIRLFQIVLLFTLLPIMKNIRSRKVFCFFSATLFLSVYFSVQNGFYELHELIPVIVQLMIFVVTISYFFSIKYASISITTVLKWNYYGFMLGAVFGIMQFLAWHAFDYQLCFFNDIYSGMGEHLKGRIYSFFSEPNMFSIYYVLGFPLVLAYVKENRKHMIGMLIIILALILSMSRGVWIAMVVMLIMYMIKEKVSVVKIALFTLLSIPFLIVLFYLITEPELLYRLTTVNYLQDPSFTSRIQVYENTYTYLTTLFSYQPFSIALWLGHGLSSFRVLLWQTGSETNFFAMSLYVDILIEHGLLLFLGFLYTCVRLLLPVFSKSISHFDFILLLSHIAFLIACTVYPMKNIISYILPYYFCIGLYYHRNGLNTNFHKVD